MVAFFLCFTIGGKTAVSNTKIMHVSKDNERKVKLDGVIYFRKLVRIGFMAQLKVLPLAGSVDNLCAVNQNGLYPHKHN